MIELQVFDTNGVRVNLGDMLMLQHGRNNLTFYTRLQVLNRQLFPLNKICFDRMFKVDSIPENCSHYKGSECDPEYWIEKYTEAIMVKDDELEQWKLDMKIFELNTFFKVETVTP